MLCIGHVDSQTIATILCVYSIFLCNIQLPENVCGSLGSNWFSVLNYHKMCSDLHLNPNNGPDIPKLITCR